MLFWRMWYDVGQGVRGGMRGRLWRYERDWVVLLCMGLWHQKAAFCLNYRLSFESTAGTLEPFPF